MSNPISTVAVTQPPPYDQPISDKNGNITPAWGQCIFALFQRTGSTAGYDIATIQAQSQQALTTAIQAETEATAAQVLAENADTTAIAAQTLASTANNAATTNGRAIAIINTSALFAKNNLSDLTNDATARASLGVSTFPLIYQIDSASGGINRLVPAWRPLTFDTNFAGSIGYCATPPTGNVVLAISYIRGGVTTNIGSMTFYAGTHIAFFTAQPPFSVETGDIITLTGPSDATMAGIGITLSTIIG